MTKEISPRMFLLNALYSVKDEKIQISLDPKDEKYLWSYTSLATQKIREKIKDVIMYVDRNSLECALQIESCIKVKSSKLRIDDKANVEARNECLDPEIREKLPEIFREAYREI